MREEILQYIYSKNELKQFIREQPYWYRKLAREPESLEQFEIASLHYFKKTIPHRVEKFSNGLHMASMMMGMLQSLNSSG
ncbi:YlbE-like family protein [Lederbergia citrea]|uniref:YlbE-like family protein n=1 Tax=Lederbergia citrea TaxID=2833581 RepID=A0A942UHE4_9BACI|nr:YlbE-like family protein [Lederbergia citrea]MBS4177241.1 YlbE-like family protein [Lederbergia citrea]MBS4203904.1 YlbE-like family protein [Lederbergia citrea]MBS4221511.1 YlbE-like family protein [Lederbergia citrea]